MPIDIGFIRLQTVFSYALSNDSDDDTVAFYADGAPYYYHKVTRFGTDIGFLVGYRL